MSWHQSQITSISQTGFHPIQITSSRYKSKHHKSLHSHCLIMSYNYTRCSTQSTHVTTTNDTTTSKLGIKNRVVILVHKLPMAPLPITPLKSPNKVHKCRTFHYSPRKPWQSTLSAQLRKDYQNIFTCHATTWPHLINYNNSLCNPA